MRNKSLMTAAIIWALLAVVVLFVSGYSFGVQHKSDLGMPFYPFGIFISFIFLYLTIFSAIGYNMGGQPYKGKLPEGKVFYRWTHLQFGYVRISLRDAKDRDWVVEVEAPSNPSAPAFIVENGKLVPYRPTPQSSKSSS